MGLLQAAENDLSEAYHRIQERKFNEDADDEVGPEPDPTKESLVNCEEHVQYFHGRAYGMFSQWLTKKYIAKSYHEQILRLTREVVHMSKVLERS